MRSCQPVNRRAAARHQDKAPNSLFNHARHLGKQPLAELDIRKGRIAARSGGAEIWAGGGSGLKRTGGKTALGSSACGHSGHGAIEPHNRARQAGGNVGMAASLPSARATAGPTA